MARELIFFLFDDDNQKFIETRHMKFSVES
jgi:hypothetical protein